GSSTNGKKKDGFMARVQRGYNNWVSRFMKRRKTVVGLYLVGSFSLVVLLSMMLGTDLMPRQETAKQFQERLIGPEGLRLERMEERVKEGVLPLQDLVGKANIGIPSACVAMAPSSYGTSALYVFNAGPDEAILQVAMAPEY